jgi:hypothetical protein
MNYTKNEVAILISDLEQGRIFVEKFCIKVFSSFEIYYYDLYSVLRNEFQIVIPTISESTDYITYCNRLRRLNTVVHHVSLQQIPLYINSAPEIASWRLKIGK